MKYRPLGRTGFTVSEIGFGGWGIGGRTAFATSYGDTDDAVSRAALRRALDRGITFFDTSSVYGYGHSEHLIGEGLQGCRDRVVITTKAGFVTYDQPPDFSPGYLRRSLEGSLGRLRTDYVDLLQLHNPPLDLLRARPEIVAELERMKVEGKIRAFGFSLKNPADGVAAMEEFGVSALQVNLNMLDVRAQSSGLLALAEKRGAGIIARTPLCFGFLTGALTAESVFPEGDHRGNWPRSQILRWVRSAEAIFAGIGPFAGQSRAQVALRYCLSFPQVSTVIPGILTPHEVDQNAPASDLGPLSNDDVATVFDINRKLEVFGAEAK